MTSELMHISARDKGQFPISMGTSLALEGALGIYPERPESPPPILKYKELWVNLYTLFRNLLNAVDKETLKTATASDLLPALLEDMHGVAFTLEHQASHCEAVFYANHYDGLAKAFPHAKLKVPSNAWQEMLAFLERTTFEQLRQHPPAIPIKRYGWTILDHHPSSLILTHYPVDLLSRHQFQKLDLLESHSGKIKPPMQWHTKLGLSEGGERMPFHPFTLQVFGDHATQFNALRTTLRTTVVDLSKAHHWTPITTTDKIKANLKTVKDTATREALEALL